MAAHTDCGPYMLRCAQLAAQAIERGDAAVGALIVRNGVVLAEAAEQVKAALDVAGHAELIAIRRACRALAGMDLTGCTLYTNAEPCWMCSFAIREVGVSQVIIGAAVPDIGGATSRFPILSDPNIPGWRPPPQIVWLEFKQDS